MNITEIDPSALLFDALKYVRDTSGLHINETLLLPRSQSKWPSTISILSLSLGFIGLLFNILALLIFAASKTFRQNSFRCYIYAFVFVNCGSIITHSWLYLMFYLVDPIYLCKYLRYLQQSTATTSLWIMILLSLERSLTFSRPFTVKRLLRPRTICYILIIITCLCFALHIDELVSVDIKAFRWVNFAYGLCSVQRHSRLATERIKIIAHSHSFILPFLLNSILDIYICYKICQRRKRLVIKPKLLVTNNSKKKKSLRSKKSLAHEITITLLCQSIWLLFTYFPTHLYYFLISFNIINDHDRDNSTLNFLMRQNLLIYLAFSPALYVILSPTLRKEICLYICLSYKRHRSASLSNISSAQNKFRHFFLNHHGQQHRSIEQINLTILVTTSEQVTRKILSETAVTPLKMQYVSRSVPCLIICNKEDEYGRHTIERCNTLNQ